MGAGTNRMNKYTIGKATQGLGTYLLDNYGVEACAKRGVVIGYDTRNNSKDFSEITANVLTGMGIKVYLHSEARPTPQLSFSVKFLNALAGVVVTASHNPKEYNGYKVYDEYGCQLVPWQAKQVIQYVNAIEDYHTISFEGNNSLLEIVEVTDNFVSEVMKQSRYKGSIYAITWYRLCASHKGISFRWFYTDRDCKRTGCNGWKLPNCCFTKPRRSQSVRTWY